MPRKKEINIEDDFVYDLDMMGMLTHKKHKKHKHKKHKRKKEVDSDGEDSLGEGSPSHVGDVKRGLKLKIKIGGQTFGETRVSKHQKGELNESLSAEALESGIEEGILVGPNGSPINVPKKGKKVDEEEAWLEALEAGRLEEVDEELRRMKDPNLMTARQRSLFESKAQKDKEDATTPVVQEEVQMTEEMIQRKMIRAKKRKEQAEEKREKDKKQTIERLLKKADSKIKMAKKLTTAKKTETPKVTYINSQLKGINLTFPEGCDLPLQQRVPKSMCRLIRCGVEGCKNLKRYSCSKTGIPLCSLECYKKNIRAQSFMGTTIISVI